jgi:hypothetical protein
MPVRSRSVFCRSAIHCFPRPDHAAVCESGRGVIHDGSPDQRHEVREKTEVIVDFPEERRYKGCGPAFDILTGR